MISAEDVISILKDVTDSDEFIDSNSSLIGANSMVDSMAIVQMCVALEELSEAKGFSFDWTSEKAMSTMNSVFKSPQAVSDEFNRQLKLFTEQLNFDYWIYSSLHPIIL